VLNQSSLALHFPAFATNKKGGTMYHP